MRRYITQLSKEDFEKLYPYYPLIKEESSFPQVVAMISNQYPALPYNKINSINIKNTKHIYSTRDYWEVLVDNGERHKIPKRYTDAIYLIEED